MTITQVSDYMKIQLDNHEFNLNDLTELPKVYLPLIKPLFQDKVFAKKPIETNKHYYKRLFLLLCNRVNKVGYTFTGDTQTPQVTIPKELGVKVLQNLGIDVIRYNKHTLNVLFKHTGKKYKMKQKALEYLVNKANKTPWNFKSVVDSLKFGVELEFVADPHLLEEFCNAMVSLVGEQKFDPVMRYHHNKGDIWELGKDGSVHRTSTSPTYYTGYELTSPILDLNNKKDLETLEAVCNLVKEIFHGRTNKTCGTHVHISFDVPEVTDALCAHFSRWYNKSEESLFDTLVPLYRRGDRARYAGTCDPTRLYNRYQKLNLCNAVRYRKNMHLEFRQLEGTLDYDKILTWIKVQKIFIEATMSNWDAVRGESKGILVLNLEDVLLDKDFSEIKSITDVMEMSNLIKEIA